MSEHSTSSKHDLTEDDFKEFFYAIHNQKPFPWQVRLTRQVLNDGWPHVIDLPTGTGKTSVLDTAVFVLAARPRESPRRVVFVIDRRIVVDQVYKRAEKIREGIKQANNPTLLKIRERLKSLGAADLGISSLRGGIPVDREWSARPERPWIVVSTVDQFGSRLLFRGYGVRPKMRSIYAGLAGNDCLVILDEVHLSAPFAETLSEISRAGTSILPRRFHVVKMSATPDGNSTDRFTLDYDTDLAGCDELRHRVEAKKEVELIDVASPDHIPQKVAKIVSQIKAQEHGPRSIGVIVNRVRTARQTYNEIKELAETHLLTGRMRPYDKANVVENIQNKINPDRDPDGLVVIVSTQAIEVGADFNFEALITECASIDSIRQRFGRLDRRGKLSSQGIPAKAYIIGPKTVVGSKKPDPIYSDSVKETWKELKKRLAGAESIELDSKDMRDFPEDAVMDKPNAPLLLETYMNAWVQTNPEPLTQPSIEPFLHGIGTNTSIDVSILWRVDRTQEGLEKVHPHQAEFLQVPINAAKVWLAGEPEVETADIPTTDPEGGKTSSAGKSKVVHTKTDGIKASKDLVRWNGIKDKPETIDTCDVRAGDVLVVDPSRGGLTEGTWDPESDVPVSDIGDLVNPSTLRLHPDLWKSPPTPSQDPDPDSNLEEQIRQWLMRAQEVEHQTPIKKYKLDDVKMSCIDVVDANTKYYILIQKPASKTKHQHTTVSMDGAEESRWRTGSGMTLNQHLERVGNKAVYVAKCLGLPKEIVDDIGLAGRLHDIGKVDRRFQMQLVGGDLIEMAKLGEPLAKSLPGIPRVYHYPRGMRHEIASMAMVASCEEVLANAHDSDLVLHLIGTHHGHGRPLPPVIKDENNQRLCYNFEGQELSTSTKFDEMLALDMADRFWNLVAKYGYYGLAWLEAIVRLADHQISSEEAAR